MSLALALAGNKDCTICAKEVTPSVSMSVVVMNGDADKFVKREVTFEYTEEGFYSMLKIYLNLTIYT